MNDSQAFQRGDVVWAPDPFRAGSNPRLWPILVAESLPYAGEEYIRTALTTSDLPRNFEVGDDWVVGQDPETTSYCSPWVLATIKHEAIASPQGIITEEFTDGIMVECKTYLETG